MIEQSLVTSKSLKRSSKMTVKITT